MHFLSGPPMQFLSGVDRDWLFATYAAHLDAEGYIDGYYMNGPNVEGLVRAVRFASGRG